MLREYLLFTVFNISTVPSGTLSASSRLTSQAVPPVICQGLQSLNRMVDLSRTFGPGVPEVLTSHGDPALVVGIAASAIFIFVIGVILLRQYFPKRCKRVRDTTVRLLRTVAIPFAWLLHCLGDLSHLFWILH
jgi:hypothetical protein